MTDRSKPPSAEPPHRNESITPVRPRKSSMGDGPKPASDSIPRRTSSGQAAQQKLLTCDHVVGQTTAAPTGATDLVGVVKEELATQDTIEHIANHCQTCLALCGIKQEREVDLDEEATACPARLDELDPHQFAQAFKAAKGKNPDILSCKEAMADCENLKDWLASALKEIRQLEKKGVWVECQKSEAKGQQIVPCAWVF